jgi:hypothetical protein
MLRAFPLLTGMVLLALAALVHGVATGRWQTGRALQDAAARVPLVPLTIGDWKGTERPPDHDAFAQAGARAYWMRVYKDQRTGEEITVLLMCGRAGRMGVHTPEICYGGAGYDVVGEPVHEQVETTQPAAVFWTARFRKPGPAGDSTLLIHWAWTPDGAWQAPEKPRWAFAGEPFLYKLYLVRDVTGLDEPADRATSRRFLQAFLPELRKTLFPVNDSSREKL